MSAKFGKEKTLVRAISTSKRKVGNRRYLYIALFASVVFNARAQEHEPSFVTASLSPAPTASTETQDATVEPSPIPSTEYHPPPVTTEPELPSHAAEPEVTINEQPVSENVRRFRYHFTVTVRTVYDDNIGLNNANRIADFYTSFEPTVRLTLGEPGSESNNVLQFIYAPSFTLFASHSEADALQHLIHLEGQHVFGKLSASLSQDVQILDGNDLRSLTDTTGRQANFDVGARTRQDIYTTRLALAYDLSSKTFLSGGVDYNRNDYSTLISSEQIAANLFINYNYSPKLVLGLGGTFGYNDTDGPTPTQHFEQANLRANFNPGEKLNLSASVGIEFRQFEGDTRGTHTSPVFELSANYKPFDGTTISLTGSRRTQNSAVIAGGDYVNTDIRFAVQQRFLQRLFLSLSTGYENAVYFSAFNGMDLGRTDDYYYLQAAIDVNITRFWDVGFYYLHREDTSSLDTFTFSDNQFGIRTSLIF
jgi:hypothetical protein